jgi:dCMP deaminase
LVVRDRRIIATGYVGSPPGQPHCDEAGHQLKHLRDETGLTTTHCLRTIHAELNAICQAARYGIALEETTLYTKMEPCRTCAAAIVAVGISRVVASRGYHAASEARELLKAAGVQLEVFEDRVEQYELQREDAAGTGSDR